MSEGGVMLEYTEQQESLRQTVREFARKEIAPGAAERDATGQFDYDLYRRVGELGIWPEYHSLSRAG